MSILQEYEDIKETISKREFNNVNKFLEQHPKLQIADVYFSPKIHLEFEKWEIKYEKNRLNYFNKGLSNDPFIRLSLEDLMKELSENLPLSKHVLAYAKSNLSENSMFDKNATIRAIKTQNVETLYNADTEVRENFCECFKGGVKALYADWLEKARDYRNDNRTMEGR